MGGYLESVKHFAQQSGLYKPAHRLWLKRPDFRLGMYNLGYRLAGASDGLPIPPTRLIELVQSRGEIAQYLKGGELGVDGINNALLHIGYSIERFERVLDFGCGCGRIIRHWHQVKGMHFYGTDLNRDLIHWCQTHLGKQAEFITNNLVPPLDFLDDYFDFIYSISVFTHLSEHVQEEWMHELARVLKKKGLLLITVHGEWRVNDLTPEEQKHFYAGHLVVRNENVEGSNLCGAYHPHAYVRSHLATGFEVLYFIETGAIDVGQDLYIFGKPA